MQHYGVCCTHLSAVFQIVPCDVVICLSLLCTCHCGNTCNPVGQHAWLHSLRLASLIPVTQDVTFSSSDLGQNWADARIRFPLDINQASLLSQDPGRFKKHVGLGSDWSEGRVLFKDYCDYCFCH